MFSVSPILLGFSDSAIWGFPWEFSASEPWFIVKTTVMMLIVAVVLSLIPVLGTFSSFITFVMGAFALFTLLNNAPNFSAERIIFFPNLFTSVGFVVISAFISWAAFMLVGLILTGMGKDETWMPIVGIPLASTPGLVSILFYGAYLGSPF